MEDSTVISPATELVAALNVEPETMVVILPKDMNFSVHVIKKKIMEMYGAPKLILLTHTGEKYVPDAKMKIPDGTGY